MSLRMQQLMQMTGQVYCVMSAVLVDVGWRNQG